jgi:hypothetical protein
MVGSVVNLRPSTRLRDATYLRRYVLPRFGELPLEAIRQREVPPGSPGCSPRSAPATVVKAYQLLNKVMSTAVDAGMLVQSPCRNVPLPRAEPKEMRYLNPAEVAALAAGIVDVAETINELKGRLALGPPKTKASRRKVSLPARRRRGAGRAPAVAGPAHRLRVPGTRRPGAADLQLPPAHLTPRRGRRQPRRPADPRPAAHGGRAVDRRRRLPEGGRQRAGHTSVSFVLDRYGHLFPEADTALRARLDELFCGVTEPRRNTAGSEIRTAPWA